MTRESTKKKRDKKRAEKKKHEHRTEQVSEEMAKRHRSHGEEMVAMIVLVIFVPFMIIATIWWPTPSSAGKMTGQTGLPTGTYQATYVQSRPATESESAAVVLDIKGESVLVTPSDLAGSAAKDPGNFFEGQPGDQVEITVDNGFITKIYPGK